MYARERAHVPDQGADAVQAGGDLSVIEQRESERELPRRPGRFFAYASTYQGLVVWRNSYRNNTILREVT